MSIKNVVLGMIVIKWFSIRFELFMKLLKPLLSYDVIRVIRIAIIRYV